MFPLTENSVVDTLKEINVNLTFSGIDYAEKPVKDYGMNSSTFAFEMKDRNSQSIKISCKTGFGSIKNLLSDP